MPAATAGPTSGSATTFAWEYKGQRADLDAVFGQLRLYALALENPPLLIVSDMLRFRHPHQLGEQRQQDLQVRLGQPLGRTIRNKLKWTFSDPEQLRPGETRQSLTEQAAESCMFAADSPLPLEKSDIDTVLAASNLDRSEIDPSILATFVPARARPRQARPSRRAQYGTGSPFRGSAT